MKTLKILLTILFFVLMSCSCDNINSPIENMAESQNTHENKALARPENAVKFGNVSNNFTLWVAADGDAFYYSSGKDIKKITSGSEQILLATESSLWINTMDGWLYCDGREKGNPAIYKLSTFGTEQAVIAEFDPSEGNPQHLLVVNNWLYFQNHKGLCRMDLQTEEIEIVFQGSGDRIGVKDEWIYMQQKGKIYKFHLNGSDKALVYGDDYINYAFLDGDWIYFTSISNASDDGNDVNGKLKRIRTDGSDLMEYDQQPFGNYDTSWAHMYIWVHGGWVYYTYGEISADLRRISPDGDIDELYIEGRIGYVYFAEEWIFFRDYTIGDAGAYMMKLDKSEKVKLCSFDVVDY
ncbi:MAG: DUF5050 domain-containing protein [Clostridiales bacterium]|nr:DUF5050 domain-containing protein [Clostridiales bacterium]